MPGCHELNQLTGPRHAQMAAGLQRYKVFATAIDEAEVNLKELGATWSLKGTCLSFRPC